MSPRKLFDAREIVVEAGMSARPGFYSGRGATTSDLNDKILEKVYQGILKNYGQEPAKEFVNMVADIPKLSATDFLLTLYRLEAHEWKWDKRFLGSEKGIYPEDEGSAMATVIDVLYGMNKTDETDYIRGEFLRKHGTGTRSKHNTFFD